MTDLPRVAAFAAALAYAGCGAGASPAQAPGAGGEPEGVPPDEAAVRAVDDLTVSAEQRAKLRTLRERLAAELAPAAGVRPKLVQAYLDGIAAGRLDPARIDPLERDFVAATDRARPAVLAALNELHAILTPAQRAALVDAIAEHGEQARAQGRERVRRLAEALGLSASQKRQIFWAARERLGEKRERMEELHEGLRAAGAAFKTEAFDATKLAVASAPLVQEWLGGIRVTLELLLPVLDREQRSKLVQVIRRKMEARPQRP
ncbi:MAG: Spy/CpxP family protein refolding chaperone [Deltaproteobacteria bacterium]|nr:Spy/CpxP family protein refolding chaperone [Deltaproteobacteria bacterium]